MHGSDPARPDLAPPDPVLPDRSADDSDQGWGERGDDPGRGSDDWYRQEKPPHHGD